MSATPPAGSWLASSRRTWVTILTRPLLTFIRPNSSSTPVGRSRARVQNSDAAQASRPPTHLHSLDSPRRCMHRGKCGGIFFGWKSGCGFPAAENTPACGSAWSPHAARRVETNQRLSTLRTHTDKQRSKLPRGRQVRGLAALARGAGCHGTRTGRITA